MCSFIIRTFPLFKKTMRRGSSLKFTVLRNYQNNCAFTFPAKRNIRNLLFSFNTMRKGSSQIPESKQQYCRFTVEFHLRPASVAFQANWWGMRFGRNALHMSEWPCLELPCLVLGKQCDSDIFYSTSWVKTFREENNLLTIGLLTRNVNCWCCPHRRKHEMTRYKTAFIYICSNYPKVTNHLEGSVWQKHIKFS